MSVVQNPFLAVRMRSGWNQSVFARRLGVSRSYLSELENDHRSASAKVLRRLADLSDTVPRRQKRDPAAGVPLLSWAKAGSGGSFEELPPDWQERICTDCDDDSAFALTLEGDSMEPLAFPGDVVVISPGKRLASGSFAAARLKDRGVVFKRVTIANDAKTLRFTSANPAYPEFEADREQVEWIYPAVEIRRKL